MLEISTQNTLTSTVIVALESITPHPHPPQILFVVDKISNTIVPIELTYKLHIGHPVQLLHQQNVANPVLLIFMIATFGDLFLLFDTALLV